MGIVIEKQKNSQGYGRHANAADDFALDAAGRLLPAAGEVFEIMPLGSLDVVAFANIGNAYRQNPYTMPGMRWEIGFSANRLYLYSPHTSALLGGVTERQGQSTLGFYYFNELRSMSLGSARENGGPYVSTIFVIQVAPTIQIPVGVRVHGTGMNLHAFATMLAARCVETYLQLSTVLGLDTSALGAFFEEVNAFDYQTSLQTDFFITATENHIEVARSIPQVG